MKCSSYQALHEACRLSLSASIILKQDLWNATHAEQPHRPLQAFIEREHEFKLVVEKPLDPDGNLMGCAAVGGLLCKASAPHGDVACMHNMQHHKTAGTLNQPAKLTTATCLPCPAAAAVLGWQSHGLHGRACTAASATHTCTTATSLPCSAAAAAYGCAHRVAQGDCWLNTPTLQSCRMHALLCPCRRVPNSLQSGSMCTPGKHAAAGCVLPTVAAAAVTGIRHAMQHISPVSLVDTTALHDLPLPALLLPPILHVVCVEGASLTGPA